MQKDESLYLCGISTRSMPSSGPGPGMVSRLPLELPYLWFYVTA